MRLQPWHILVLLLVVMLVFGASRLPDIARNLGKSAKVLKEEIKDLRDDEPVPPTSGQPPYQGQQPYQQQPYQTPAAPPPSSTGPYTPGGSTPTGVDSPTNPPGAAPASPTEWPPGSSQR